ncbi:MAG TPA: glycosyltransferase family 39 protein [Eudoraea sp.]|nr:glycosyltransferase family 39 protein [Eudoraea sp.]
MIPNTRYWFLLLLISLVYLTGLFVTLFENDSAQFAVMAMRMVQENDFMNLFKGQEPYLDKPHMHFWLAALSFKIFGLHDWAYRIPGILTTFLGAYSCFGLGKLLYDHKTGRLAALIFLTAQTIVLAAIDVRTDAVLTGFTIFAIWQLASFIENNSLKNILFGAFGAGMAFSTKGQIALLVIGLPLLCHLAYTRKWKVLINWRVLAALLVFGMTIAPMLYAYYLQFDLHPEQVIRSKSNRSGIRFIFWEQSFERLSGEGVGRNSSDYFFFFHTFLWVFLPWTVISLIALWKRIRAFAGERLRYDPKYEFLTLGGIVLVFTIISFAQFKLPHYLNIAIPLFSVLTASFLSGLYSAAPARILKTILGIQYFILSLVFIVSTLLCFFVFKAENPLNYIWKALLAILVVYYSLKRENYILRITTVSVLSAVMLNAVLNTHFYPSLLKYQGGSAMAELISEENIPTTDIYKINPGHTWALDFYNRKPVPVSSLSHIEKQEDVWIYASDNDLKTLREYGFDWDMQHTVNQFRITRLQAKFLAPATRKKVVNKMHLVHVY